MSSWKESEKMRRPRVSFVPPRVRLTPDVSFVNSEGRIRGSPSLPLVCVYDVPRARYVIPAGLRKNRGSEREERFRARGDRGERRRRVFKGRKIICREWRKSAATSRQNGDICRTICNLTTESRTPRSFIFHFICLCTAVLGPATARLARNRTGKEGKTRRSLRREIVSYKKKREKNTRKNTGNSVEHARVVRAAICTFDTIEYRNSTLSFRAPLLSSCTELLPVIRSKVRRKIGICSLAQRREEKLDRTLGEGEEGRGWEIESWLPKKRKTEWKFPP